MAITEIHAITRTPRKALAYIVSDKIELYVSDDEINKDVAHRVFEDNGKKYVQYFTLISYQCCNALNPYDTYQDIQNKWQGKKYKNNGNKTKSGNEPLMYHLYQSFSGFETSPEVANEIGRKFAEEVFKGFSVTIATHGNTDNIHNHFIISAWDNDGKKWNDCHRTKREIRAVSDRLCEEYGLHVLEHTRDMKLVKYTDKEGITRYYEPTDRKNELIKKRESGEITIDRVGSYRNTKQYEELKQTKENNHAEIKADIDTVLPSCRSYEELLERLRDLGYTIRDKKKNGDWLAHISFQSPLQEKAIRDDKIGNGVFYIRENLAKYIENHAKESEYEREVTHREDEVEKAVPFFSEYEYGKTDLSEINNDYRTVREENGMYRTIERADSEKKVLLNIRMKDSEVHGLIDATQLQKLILEQAQQKSKKKPYQAVTNVEKLVIQIQSSFRCLQYTEKYNLYSYAQIIDLYAANKAKYDATIENFAQSEQGIKKAKELLVIPEKLSALLDKIESKRKDVDYILEEYNMDKKLVAQYRGIMEKQHIDTPHGLETFERKVAEWEMKQDKNNSYMEKVIDTMQELENCIRTFDRIDTENGIRDEQSMKKFEQLTGQHEVTDTRKKEHESR